MNCSLLNYWTANAQKRMELIIYRNKHQTHSNGMKIIAASCMSSIEGLVSTVYEAYAILRVMGKWMSWKLIRLYVKTRKNLNN